MASRSEQNGWGGVVKFEPVPDEHDEQPLWDENPPRKLTRNERLQLTADAGIDTWEEYRGER